MCKGLMVLVAVFLIPLSGWAKQVKFRMEIKPMGRLASSGLDGFGLRVEGSDYAKQEVRDKAKSYVGALEFGIQIDADICFVDLLAGGGLVGNGAFIGDTVHADAGCRFKLNESGSLAVGPFVGVVAPGTTKWKLNTNDKAEMKGLDGLRAGIKFTWGWERVSFLLEAGYMNFSYEISPKNDSRTWSYTDNGGRTWNSLTITDRAELDMDGLYGNFGVSLQF